MPEPAILHVESVFQPGGVPHSDLEPLAVTEGSSAPGSRDGARPGDEETRLAERFPCNSVCFCPCCTLSFKGPEPPRKASNLSPEPSPNGARTCRRRRQQASVARGSARPT